MRASWLALLVVVALLGCSKSEGGGGSGGSGGGGGAGGSGGSGGAQATEMHVTGLVAPADVTIDGFGILHVSCASDRDCIFLQGYFHAQYRFFEMDFFRKVSRSQLATLLPHALVPQAVDTDESLRPLLSTRQGDPIGEAIWADEKVSTDPAVQDAATLVQAYTDGVNAWLGDLRAKRNGATLTREYTFAVVTDPTTIADWDPVDTVAFARLQTLQLGYSGGTDLSLGAAMGSPDLSTESFLDVFNQLPGVDAFTFTAAGNTYPTPPAAQYRPPLSAWDPLRTRLSGLGPTLHDAAERMRRATAILAPLGEPAGSNNWVVAPTNTMNHDAMLANDPHLTLTNPSIWTMVELNSKAAGGTLHVAGASFPGAPGVEIGRNENVAWGATVAEYDTADAYVETPAADGKGVMFNGQEVAYVTKTVTFNVKGGSAQTKTFQFVPHHGPVVATAPDGRPITIRWTGFEVTHEIAAFLGLAKSATVAEGMDALKHFRVGAQNFVLADTHGDIGWDPHADVPNRPWLLNTATAQASPPWLPMDGQGANEWGTMIADDQLPRLTTAQAKSGFIPTANNDMTGGTKDNDPTNDGYMMLQNYPAVSFREGRIVQLLSARTDHTTETLVAIQGDNHSLVADTILPKLISDTNQLPLTQDAQDVLTTLSTWDHECPTGLTGDTPDAPVSTDPAVVASASGCSAFHALLDGLYTVVLADEYQQAGMTVSGAPQDELIRPITYLFSNPAQLRNAAALWDDKSTTGVTETEDEGLPKALDMAGKHLKSLFGPMPSSWIWGRKHTLTMDFMGIPGTALTTYAAPGGLFTVNVANPEPEGADYSFSSGPSLRIVNDASPTGITTLFQLPGGQDEHVGAEHYGDLVVRWLHNQPFQFPFTPSEVDAAAKVRLRVLP